jgi:hypothetical protein
MAIVTIMLQPQRLTNGLTNGSATQLSLFPDESAGSADTRIQPGTDGLAPVRGMIASVTLALLLWAAVLTLVWSVLR